MEIFIRLQLKGHFCVSEVGLNDVPTSSVYIDHRRFQSTCKIQLYFNNTVIDLSFTPPQLKI